MSKAEKGVTFDKLYASVEREVLRIGITHYFNNFNFNLPDPDLPEFPDEPGRSRIRPRFYAVILPELSRLDVVHGESFRNHGDYSPLFLSQTHREFFLIIDNLIEELHLDGVIERYYRRKKEDRENEMFHRADFYTEMMPLYVRLLHMGYNKEDLTT